MAGSGKHPGKEALKNKAMLVVRNVTKQEVTNVIFPNGLTVGTVDLKNGAKIHGNVQVAGTLNAQDLRINGTTVGGGDFLLFETSSPYFAFPTTDSTTPSPDPIVLSVLQVSQSSTIPGNAFQVSGSDGTNLTGSLSGDSLVETSPGNASRFVNLSYDNSSMRSLFPLTASVTHEGITQTKYIYSFFPDTPKLTSLEVVVNSDNVVLETDDEGVMTSNLSETAATVIVLDNGTPLPIDDTSSPSDSTWKPAAGSYKSSGLLPSTPTFTYTNGDTYAVLDAITSITTTDVYRTVDCVCRISGSDITLVGKQNISKAVTSFSSIVPVIDKPTVTLVKNNWTDSVVSTSLPSKPNDASACDTDIKVYKNGNTINYDGGASPANETFSVTNVSAVNIGVPSIGVGSGAKVYNTGYPNGSTYTGTDDSATITYTVRYVDGSGNFTYFPLKQGISLYNGPVKFGSFVVKGSIDFGGTLPSNVVSMQTNTGFTDVYVILTDNNSDDNQFVDGYNSYLAGYELTGNDSSLWVEQSGGAGDDIEPTINSVGVGFTRDDPTDDQTNSSIVFTPGKQIRIVGASGVVKMDTLRFLTSGIGSGPASCDFRIDLYAVTSEVADPTSSSGPNRKLRYVTSFGGSSGTEIPLDNYAGTTSYVAIDQTRSNQYGVFFSEYVSSDESLVAVMWLDRSDSANVIPDGGTVTFGPIEVSYVYDF